jgi:hypothetical protein
MDPMDVPPVDHGSDRYDYIEIRSPHASINPSGDWFKSLIAEPCPDCRANLFLDYLAGDPALRNSWLVQYAHDETCPTLRRIDRR